MSEQRYLILMISIMCAKPRCDLITSENDSVVDVWHHGGIHSFFRYYDPQPQHRRERVVQHVGGRVYKSTMNLPKLLLQWRETVMGAVTVMVHWQ